MVTNFAKKIF